MPLDGNLIRSLVHELQPLVGTKIEKVNQPEKDEIVLSIRQDRKNKKLLISSSSAYPRISYTNLPKENPKTPPSFCMLLRKYVEGGRISSITQVGNDRIVHINLTNKDDMGFDSSYSLILEMMNRHSNLSLVRNSDNVIMDSIKHLNSSMNTYRVLYPGVVYKSPPESNKLNPFNFTKEDFNSFLSKKALEFNESFLMKTFEGISKPFSSSFYKYATSMNDFDENKIDVSLILNYFENLKQNKYDFNLYLENNNTFDFYCTPILSYAQKESKSYENASLLIEDFYSKKDMEDRLSSKSHDLVKLINNNLDRCLKKDKILKEAINKSETIEKYKLYGELLTANIYLLKNGMNSIKVVNYYTNEEIEIPLNEHKSVSYNVQYYYKKYNKLKKSKEQALIQLELNSEELNYLDSVLTNIKNSESYKDLDDIRDELRYEKYLKLKKSAKNKKEKPSTAIHLKSSSGFDIYIGKNNIQNDFLTTKFANKNDLWFHAKNVPGSHVILASNGVISDKDIEEAASLAAFYSKAKNGSKVEVDYTYVKNIKKINGSKPGMVIYHTNFSINVAPKQFV